MQLRFAHRSFETEQQTIVEVRRIVHPILIEDQRIGQRADLQQAMPVRVVPRQARDLQSHDDAGAAHAHIGHQMLKALAPDRRRAGLALIAIHHDDLIFAPAERDGSAAQSVLALRALHVLDDLPHRGLSNIQVRAPLHMVRLHFHGLAHDLAPRCSAFMAIAAKI